MSITQRMRELWRTIRISLQRESMPGSLIKKWLLPAVELSMIAILAIWIGRDYLDLDPKIVPSGRELMVAIQSHNFWNQIRDCGWCAVWNGSSRGGYPAFVETYGAPLHPVIGITTLLWGVINGVKVAMLVSLWFAGLAQWWIARELGLGWIARLWSSLTIIACGHLAGRMEGGAFTLVLSTAMVSLVIPGLLMIDRRGDKRAIILLAVVSASAILAGQGYLLLGLLAAMPGLAFLLFDENLRIKPIWKKYTRAGGLAILLAAPFLVPLVHFLPHFGKAEDLNFIAAQPLEYLPLNLVINNFEYYLKGGVLGALPAPALYTLFIGWVPIFLAFVGIGLAKGEDRRKIKFFAVGAVLVLLVASEVVVKWLVEYIPAVAAVRFPSLLAGIAVPMILGMAAYGLDRLLKLEWPNLILGHANIKRSTTRTISLKWILLIPLVINLSANISFSQAWLTTIRQYDDVEWLIEQLDTNDLQWVSTPFGEHFWITPAVTSGIKLSVTTIPWWWKDREVPRPRVEAIRGELPEGSHKKVGQLNDINIYLYPDEYYAAVMADTTQQPCVATGSGGQIKVECDTKIPGRLVVKENMWSGWKAWRDGEVVSLTGKQWLEVDALTGQHTYLFRYLPWDVPFGFFLLAIGILMCVWFWRRSLNEIPNEEVATGAEKLIT